MWMTTIKPDYHNAVKAYNALVISRQNYDLNLWSHERFFTCERNVIVGDVVNTVAFLASCVIL